MNIKLAETTGEESSTIHAAERMHAAVASHAISFGGDQQHYTDGAPTVEADASAVLDALPPPTGASRQFILTMATVGAAHDARLRRHFPRAERVSHVGVLPPSLRQRFHLVAPEADDGKHGELIKLLDEV